MLIFSPQPRGLYKVSQHIVGRRLLARRGSAHSPKIVLAEIAGELRGLKVSVGCHLWCVDTGLDLVPHIEVQKRSSSWHLGLAHNSGLLDREDRNTPSLRRGDINSGAKSGARLSVKPLLYDGVERYVAIEGLCHFRIRYPVFAQLDVHRTVFRVHG